MSFSGEIKEELSTVTDQSRHCRLAELAAIISGCGQMRMMLMNWKSAQKMSVWRESIIHWSKNCLEYRRLLFCEKMRY